MRIKVRKVGNSEHHLKSYSGRELHAARSASAQDGIAQSNIGGGDDRQEAQMSAGDRIKPVWRRVGNEGRQVGVGEVGMVCHVEEVHAQVELETFGEAGVLRQG